jgi:hypothetical protein
LVADTEAMHGTLHDARILPIWSGQSQAAGKELIRHSIVAIWCFMQLGLACPGILEDKEECYTTKSTGFLFGKRL